jgi:hypothetical protein
MDNDRTFVVATIAASVLTTTLAIVVIFWH